MCPAHATGRTHSLATYAHQASPSQSSSVFTSGGGRDSPKTRKQVSSPTPSRRRDNGEEFASAAWSAACSPLVCSVLPSPPTGGLEGAGSPMTTGRESGGMTKTRRSSFFKDVRVDSGSGLRRSVTPQQQARQQTATPALQTAPPGHLSRRPSPKRPAQWSPTGSGGLGGKGRDSPKKSRVSDLGAGSLAWAARDAAGQGVGVGVSGGAEASGGIPQSPVRRVEYRSPKKGGGIPPPSPKSSSSFRGPGRGGAAGGMNGMNGRHGLQEGSGSATEVDKVLDDIGSVLGRGGGAGFSASLRHEVAAAGVSKSRLSDGPSFDFIKYTTKSKYTAADVSGKGVERGTPDLTSTLATAPNSGYGHTPSPPETATGRSAGSSIFRAGGAEPSASVVGASMDAKDVAPAAAEASAAAEEEADARMASQIAEAAVRAPAGREAAIAPASLFGYPRPPPPLRGFAGGGGARVAGGFSEISPLSETETPLPVHSPASPPLSPPPPPPPRSPRALQPILRNGSVEREREASVGDVPSGHTTQASFSKYLAAGFRGGGGEETSSSAIFERLCGYVCVCMRASVGGRRLACAGRTSVLNHAYMHTRLQKSNRGTGTRGQERFHLFRPFPAAASGHGRALGGGRAQRGEAWGRRGCGVASKHAIAGGIH